MPWGSTKLVLGFVLSHLVHLRSCLIENRQGHPESLLMPPSRRTLLLQVLLTQELEKNFIQRRISFFFLSGCCIAQRRSLSARSPFCQLKLSEESQIHWKSFSAKATNLKRTTKKNTNHVAVSRRVQGRVGVSLFLGSEEFHSLSSLTMLTTHRQRPPSSLFIF